MSVISSNNQIFDVYSKYNGWVEKYAGGSKSGGNGLTSSASGTGVSALLTGDGRQELQKALAAMKKEGYTSFSFSDVEDYRRKLESDFASAVRSDLAEMGVAPDIEFQLVLDAQGNVQVISGHEDKAVIERYLADNREMVGVFKHIQALSNLKKSRQMGAAQNMAVARDLKLSLQAEALQAFFESTDNNGQDYFSQIANFGANDATSYFLGLNQKV